MFMNSNADYCSLVKREMHKTPLYLQYPTSIILSPLTFFVASLGCKKKMNPNFLTLCMFFSVLLSMPFLYCPSFWSYLVAFFLVQFFEVFDDADGIVARVTGQLSPFGQQLDYLMHIICHPIMIVSFCFAEYNVFPGDTIFGYSKLVVILIACLALMFLELSRRALTGLMAVDKLRVPQVSSSGISSKFRFPKFVAAIYSQMFCVLGTFPVFALLFPLALFLDGLFGTYVSSIYFIVYFVFSSAHFLKTLFSLLFKYVFYKY